MKINIAGGSGPMGRVHKPVFESAGHEVIISGRTSSPTLEEAAAMSDLTIVTVPLDVTENIIKRVAPHAKAMMDFTSLKQFPLETMMKYALLLAEVGGLHPLYGEVKSIKGRSIIYCPTKRSGPKCGAIVNSLEQSGANIIYMTPAEHDAKANAIGQVARTELLESYAILIRDSGMTPEELYHLSSPPTQIILDLIARQVNPANDELYASMRRLNPHARGIMHKLSTNLTDSDYSHPEKIRKLYGEKFLAECQARAQKMIDGRTTNAP